MRNLKKVLTIAGSDSSGGAGIEADLKTFIANDVYGMAAITALTAQNTTGVRGIMNVDCDFIKMQIDACFEDIYPDGVKIGMVPTFEGYKCIYDRLKWFGAKNIVCDPVMVSTSGCDLCESDGVQGMKEYLFKIATLITPNISEAQVLSKMKIQSFTDMEKAARVIFEQCGCGVLVKGGHIGTDANDFLYFEGRGEWICGRRIKSKNTHGTGCTLSSAIAAYLAKGFDVKNAVKKSKEYLAAALSSGLDIGKGAGPLDHGIAMQLN